MHPTTDFRNVSGNSTIRLVHDSLRNAVMRRSFNVKAAMLKANRSAATGTATGMKVFREMQPDTSSSFVVRKPRLMTGIISTPRTMSVISSPESAVLSMMTVVKMSPAAPR